MRSATTQRALDDLYYRLNYRIAVERLWLTLLRLQLISTPHWFTMANGFQQAEFIDRHANES